MSEFEYGVKSLAEALLALAVSDLHEGEVSFNEIVTVAASFGVVLAEAN